MAVQPDRKFFARAPVATEPAQHSMNACKEDYQARLKSLQDWICELLHKNEQLRELLASAPNRRNQGDSQ
jgi:hypothetical protein